MPPGARYVRNYVLPEQFEAQLAALARWGYRTVSFGEWLAYRRGAADLPRRPIIVTFDDGYRSTYEIAWPLLQRFGYTATVFLVSASTGRPTRGKPTRPRGRSPGGPAKAGVSAGARG